MPRRRLVRATALVLGVGFVALGCSGPATESTSGASVTVIHGMGTTVIDGGPPSRVVALSASWADDLLALGVTPVGVGTITGIGPADGKFPWQKPFDAAVVPLSLLGAPDYEAIATLEPDLILADYSANNADVYQRLSAIAPTVAQLDAGAFVSDWREQVRVAGEILDREGSAEQLVAANDERLADVRRTLPGLEGKTFALATVEGGRNLGLVSAEDDAAVAVFRELGLRLDPAVVALGGGGKRVTVAAELAADALSADVLVIRAARNSDPIESVVPGWSMLPAVRSGAAAVVDRPTTGALSDPSVLNIEYLLAAVRPALESAADRLATS